MDSNKHIHDIIRTFVRDFIINDGAGFEQSDGTYAIFRFRQEQLRRIAYDPYEELCKDKDYVRLLENCDSECNCD